MASASAEPVLCRLCFKELPPAHAPLGVCVWCVHKRNQQTKRVNIPKPGYAFGHGKPEYK